MGSRAVASHGAAHTPQISKPWTLAPQKLRRTTHTLRTGRTPTALLRGTRLEACARPEDVLTPLAYLWEWSSARHSGCDIHGHSCRTRARASAMGAVSRSTLVQILACSTHTSSPGELHTVQTLHSMHCHSYVLITLTSSGDNSTHPGCATIRASQVEVSDIPMCCCKRVQPYRWCDN